MILLPNFDAYFEGSQDLGLPTSSKRDKSRFEIEAGLLFDVPLQRRKAKGKIQAIQGKVAQLNSKRQLTRDKISIEVQAALRSLQIRAEQIKEIEKAVKLAEELAERERFNFSQGASDILKITLREQYAFESREKLIEAQLNFYRAKADFRAAMGIDQLQ